MVPPVVQSYISGSQASATTARVATLENQISKELDGVREELVRLNAAVEKLAARA